VRSPLHIAQGVLSLDVGGLERLVVGLAGVARDRGHRVTVVCVERPGRLAAEAEAAGATVVSLGKPAGRLPEYIDQSAELLDRLRPDVIHTHQLGAAWYLGQAARRLGPPQIPVLHTEHGNHVAQAKGWWAAVKRRLLIRSGARVIDRFCCVSDEIAAAVTRWGTVPRGKVDVVRNGVRTEPGSDLAPPEAVRASLGVPPAAPVVGTVGRLVEVKRQDVLIRAVALLRDRFPDVRLLLVGDGPDRPQLEALTRELGLVDQVRFVGYQPRPEEFIRMMDVFCLTSRSEGLPVTLLEAWAAGVPVACSAVGGIPGVVRHEVNGLLFPPGDPAAAATALARLLDQRELRTELGEAGRRTLRQQYSVDRMASEYESRYQDLLLPSQTVPAACGSR
jgi:glycosyltransferase involved in cell wall biosynthesis